MKKLLAGLVVFCALVAAAQADGIEDITVTETGLEARIELTTGVSADLKITFEKVVGLYETGCEMGLSASLVDPTDPTLLNRLPDLQLTSVPAAFPVLIAIEPLAEEPLTFTGAVSLELHTHDLAYTANSPLRLFAADAGGPFSDITNTIGMGSYRVGASKGGFSEFLIVADLRPATAVIEEKFDRLQAILDSYGDQIDEPARTTLQSHADAAWSLYDAGDLLGARTELSDFLDAVVANSGHAIPDIWRSARDLVNVAGELREKAATLRFSLSLAASA